MTRPRIISVYGLFGGSSYAAWPTLGKFIRQAPYASRPSMGKSQKREDSMHPKFAVCCAVFAVLATPAFAQSPYHILNSYTLGGEGGWDYLNLDPDSGHLFITRGSHVIV